MNLKQKIYDLKNDRAQKMTEAEGLLSEKKLADWEARMAEVDELNREIDACEKMLAESGRFGGAQEPEKPEKPGRGAAAQGGYEEAVKRFAAAARKGFQVEKAAGDMMQEGVDADGGYTVPEDIVNRIISLRESKESLLDEVRVIPVKTRSGRRTIKKRGQHSGFSTTAEAAKLGKAATPQFDVISYEIEKRSGYLPVTTELYEDSDSDIAAFASEWLADESRVTINKEILTVAKAGGTTTVTSLDDVLKVWIGLGKAFRAGARLLTNADGLLWLGTLKDGNGRYLLNPDPTDTARMQLCIGAYRIPVKDYDNETLPSSGTKVPLLIGDLKEGIAYWDRRSFSVKVLDQATVGEFNAAEQDMLIWKGSQRDACTSWDDAAFKYCEADTAAE